MDKSKKTNKEKGEELKKKVKEVLGELGIKDFVLFSNVYGEIETGHFYCAVNVKAGNLDHVIREVFDQEENEDIRIMFVGILGDDLKGRVLEDKLMDKLIKPKPGAEA